MDGEKISRAKRKVPEVTVKANMHGFNLKQQDLSQKDFYRADFTEANLTEANLSGASLIESNMESAKIEKANMSGCVLTAANLVDTDFFAADMRGVKLNDANLTYAILAHANLQDADLSHAILVRADLRNANLQGVNFKGATFLPEIEHLTDASLRMQLDQYVYQYEQDKNGDKLKKLILHELLQKMDQMLAEGRRDDVMGCLFVAKDHKFFCKTQSAESSVYFKSVGCKEINEYMQKIPAPAAAPTPEPKSDLSE